MLNRLTARRVGYCEQKITKVSKRQGDNEQIHLPYNTHSPPFSCAEAADVSFRYEYKTGILWKPIRNNRLGALRCVECEKEMS